MKDKPWEQEFYILCQEVDTPDGRALVKIRGELTAEPIKSFKTAYSVAEQYSTINGVRVFILKAIIASVVGAGKSPVIPMFTDAASSYFKE